MRSFFTRFCVCCVVWLTGLAAPAALAQAPAWQTALVTNRSAMAADASGNIYLAGTFTGTLTLGTTTLTSAGPADLVVAKWNPARNTYDWAQQVSSAPGTLYVTSVVVAGSAVYVAGSFTGPTIAFGSTTLTNSSAGSGDIYVAKLTDTGGTPSWTWAQNAGGSSGDGVFALAINGPSLYLTGGFDSATAAFGTTTLTGAGGTFGSRTDAYVAKLTDAGSTASWTWAQHVGGVYPDYGNAIAVRGSSVYVAGAFNSPSLQFGSTTLTIGPCAPNTSCTEAFVAKLTDAGSTSSWAWALQAGGSLDDYAEAVAVEGNAVYVAGGFRGPGASFGSITLANGGAQSVSDAYVAKITDTGAAASFTWVQRISGAEQEDLLALAVRGTSIYAAGQFTSGVIDFGAFTLSNSAASSGEAFVAKLTDAGSTGSFAWAQAAGGTEPDAFTDVLLAGNRVYVGGYFVSPVINFGSLALTNPAPPFSGPPSGFLAWLADPTLAVASAASLARLSLVPNPAHGSATLHRPPGSPTGPVLLLDNLGRTVRSYPAPAAATAPLDLRGLAPGLYLVRCGPATARLVVE